MDLMTLVAKFTADTSQFEHGVKSAQSTMEQGKAAAERLDATLGKLKTAFAAVVSVAAIKQVAGAVKGLADSTAAAADRIDKQSQALGMSRKAYQQWDYILSQSGASIDSLGVSMKTLNTAILSPSDGTIEALNTLGINLEQIQGLSQEDAFEMMVRQFQKLPEGATKSALAMQMFGKQGQALMPLLNSSEDSIDSLRKSMEVMGFEMSDSMVDAGVKYNDTMDNLRRTFDGLKSIIGYGFMEPLTGILEEITKFFSQGDVQDAVKRFAVNIHDLGNVVLTHVQEFFEWLNTNGSTLTQAVSSVAEFIGDIATAIGGFAIETLKEMVGEFTEFFQNASPAQIAAVGGLALVIGLLIAPVQTLAAAAALLATNWQEVKKWAKNAAKDLDAWKDEKLSDVKTGLTNLNEKFSDVGKAVDTARTNIRNFFTRGELPEGIPEWLSIPIKAVQDAWSGITEAIDAVKTNMGAFFETGELPNDAPEWLKNPLNAIGGLWDGVVGKINTLTSTMAEFFANGELPSDAPEWIKTPIEAISGLWETITGAIDNVKTAMSNFFSTGELPKETPEWMKAPLDAVYGAWSAITTAISGVSTAINEFFDGVKVNPNTPEWVKTVLGGIQDAWDWITDSVDTLTIAISRFFNREGLGDIALPEWVTTVLGSIQDAWDWITDAVDTAKIVINSFFTEVKPTLPEWVQSVLDVIATAWNKITQAINRALNWTGTFFRSGFQLPSWAQTIQTIAGYFTNVWTWARNALEAVQSFISGSASVGYTGGSQYSALTGGGQAAADAYQQLLDAQYGNNASGLDYVPRNGYKANLHEGEAILNKRDAEEWRRGGNKGATASEIAEVLSATLEGMAVLMDGSMVGRLTARTVGRELEREARAGRFATA